MSKVRVAVFGHYDSRGGTTAIRLKDDSKEALKEAFDYYDREMFGWTPEDGVTAAGVGRKVDQDVHRLIYGDGRPSESDFMYKADLYYDPMHFEGGKPENGDYAEGMNEGDFDVIVDARSDNNRAEGEDRELELIKIPKDAFKDLDELQDWSEKQYDDTFNNAEQKAKDYGSEYIKAEDFRRWAQRDREMWEHRIEGMKWERLRKFVKVLDEFPSQTRWDDDAYGFIYCDPLR